MAGTGQLKRTPVPVLSAFFMIYIFVSGGSFGIEEMISSSGPGLTLILLLLLPVFWAMPMALVASELGSALPATGGFYGWTRHALGPFWGFQTAWWWSLATLVDASLYVVLSVEYLRAQLGFGETAFNIICWAIILVCGAINLCGVRLVALGSTVFSVLIICPLLVLSVLGIANWQFNPLTPIVPPGQSLFGGEGALVLGLSVGLWMYSGYESMSTLAGEIENPQRVIPRALMLALPFVAMMYLLPTIASIAAYGDWQHFGVTGGGDTHSFIDVGRALGGSALGYALSVSALLGNLALYLDYMGSCARPLHALAADGLFPGFLSRVSPRFGTPAAAILLVGLVNCLLVLGPFQSLVIMDVVLMICAYVVIFASAVRLRMTEPDLERPFRIPLGTVGLLAMLVLPMLLVVCMLYLTIVDRSVEMFGRNGVSLLGVEIGWYGILGMLALASGPIAYQLFRSRNPGPAR